MKWKEIYPLPGVCQGCKQEDCYNCEYAGQRWSLSREEELKMRRKMLVRAIERLQRQVQEIDKEMMQMDSSMSGRVLHRGVFRRE